MAKKTDEQDRTILAEKWAAAVADLDTARETLEHARKAEREAWAALEQSRALSIPSEDA
jgi:cob(I)alamin adenosyltransferase